MKEYMKEIRTMEDFTTASAKDDTSIFVFSADWCPDCRFLELFIGDVIKDYETKCTFYYVDRDEHMDLCQQLMIMGIPSFVAYRGGTECGRFVSKLRKTRTQIEEFLDSVVK